MRSRILIPILLVVLALRVAHAQQASKIPKRVLILDSYGQNVSLNNSVIAAFRAEVTRLSSDPIDLHEVSLEASLGEATEYEKAFANFLADRWAGRSLDLVVPMSAPAIQFAARNRKRLFGETPFLITSVEERHLRPDFLTPQTAAVADVYDLAGQIEGILRVLPRTTTIAVVLGSSPIEKFWRSEGQREFRRFADRVHFRWFEDYTFEDMKREVAALPPDSAVLYAVIWRDSAGVTFQDDQGLKGLRAVARVPFFACFERDFGSGVVGGRLFPDRSLGIEAAAAAVRILNGEPTSRVSVPPLESLPPVYDWRELERWGISESLLPPGSTVAFRPPTIWQQYRGYVLGAAGLVALQTAMIAGLLVQRRRRRRVEERLAQSEQRLQLITNSLPALVAHVDRDQRYNFANEAYEHWFGLGSEQIVGRPVREILGERLYRGVQSYVERALAGERVSFTTDTITEDGQTQSLDAIYVPDRDESGEVQGFYALVLDSTDSARAQQESRRLLIELAHADRMWMMGELAAALAHEVNQPLAAIVSNAQAAHRFLNGPSPDMDEVREIVGDIADDGARAGEVIRRMRALVKKDSTDFQSLDVNDVVHEVVGLVWNDAMLHRVEIELHLDRDLPAVSGDRIQLQQVVMNLLLNAFDAIEEGSPANRTVQVESRGALSEIHVTVRDHGPGILQEALDRLFEPFNTSKPHGLGMGLSISRSILRVHGGRLWAKNNSDGGASFSFALPIHQVSAPSGEIRHEQAAAHGVRGG